MSSLRAARRDRPAAAPFRSLRWWFAASLLSATCFYLLWPLHERERGWNDFAFVYAAGKAWLHGHSPYDVPAWRLEWSSFRAGEDGLGPTQPFLYPPYWVVLAPPLALLPWPLACRLWDLVNVASFLGICLLSASLLGVRMRSWREPTLLACLALACASGAARWALWESQMCLLPTCALLGAFWAARAKRPGWVACCAFVAALKPHIALLPLTYLFLNGAVLGLAMAALTAGVLSALVILRIGPMTFWHQLHDCYAHHMSIGFNALDQFSNFSALFARFGFAERLLFVSPLFGIASIVALSLWRTRRAAAHSEPPHPLFEPALCFALAAAFVPLHGYDLVLHLPLCVLLCELRSRLLALALAALVVAAGRAGNLEHWAQIAPLTPYFTLAICVLLAAFGRGGGELSRLVEAGTSEALGSTTHAGEARVQEPVR